MYSFEENTINVMQCRKNEVQKKLRDSFERSVEEDQFAVACEGKYTFSPTLRSGENEFCGNEVEAKLHSQATVIFLHCIPKNLFLVPVMPPPKMLNSFSYTLRSGEPFNNYI